MKVLGFDPGGASSGFGCAWLDTGNGTSRCQTVTSVDEAVLWAESVEDSPAAAGIDTLLFWQSTKSGWRGADEYLRRSYRSVQNSVVSSNGLYGSMSVQGAVLASRLRDRWTNIRLTETHPKVLWAHLVPKLPYPRDWSSDTPPVALSWMRSNQIIGKCEDDHQFDALLSAWAAGMAFSGEWSHDLVHEIAQGQAEPNVSVVPNIHYYWPA